jgi:hypothetical protein
MKLRAMIFCHVLERDEFAAQRLGEKHDPRTPERERKRQLVPGNRAATDAQVATRSHGRTAWRFQQ